VTAAAVALATCADLPEGDADERLLPPALAARGIESRWAVWDDPAVDWSSFALVVVRSTWDYTARRDEFLAWADGVARLANPAAVLRWNTDKRYLDDLASAGLPVVPTAFVVPGGPRPPLHGEVVVKPAVSGGSRDTGRFAPDRHREAHEHLTALGAAGRIAMLQPYLRSVDERGETALLHLGGELSHAIRKGAILRPGAAPLGAEDVEAGLFAAENITPRTPTDAERGVAGAVMAWLGGRFGTLLYARIDLVEGDDGEPRVLEVEVTEPSLFLGTSDGAPDRFAAAIAAAL
jgi:glutathione synthase/RimK-type ligase-like ATP-grasp enzyme